MKRKRIKKNLLFFSVLYLVVGLVLLQSVFSTFYNIYLKTKEKRNFEKQLIELKEKEEELNGTVTKLQNKIVLFFAFFKIYDIILPVKKMGINEENVLALAYLGDSVYELRIRDYLLSLNIHKVNKLQKEALKYVTAKKQCIFINYFLDNNLLTEEEIDIVKRGRNKKVNSHPKNTDIVTYKWATALECLFGYLYLKKDKNRIDELIKIIIEVNL